MINYLQWFVSFSNEKYVWSHTCKCATTAAKVIKSKAIPNQELAEELRNKSLENFKSPEWELLLWIALGVLKGIKFLIFMKSNCIYNWMSA